MNIRSPMPLVMFLTLGLPLLTGCRFTQSQLQQKRQSQAGPSAVVDGQTLTLTADLFQHHRPNRQFDLSGTLTVKGEGNLPAGLDIYHFSLRPAKAGYYVQNFQRDKKGRWIYLGPSSETVRNLTASTKQEPRALVLNFLWANLGGPFNSSAPYEKVDVTVNLRNAAGNRYTLSLPAVQAKVQQ